MTQQEYNEREMELRSRREELQSLRHNAYALLHKGRWNKAWEQLQRDEADLLRTEVTP